MDHLNETYAEADYNTQNALLTWISAGGWCWANPLTFANTQWFTENCSSTYQQLSTFFDFAKIGLYTNYDFIRYFFGVENGGSVSVVSTAAVQYANGAPNWGAQYDEIGVDLGLYWPQWLLTGIITGGRYDGCEIVCEPESSYVLACQQEGGLWDYEFCFCRTGSPILIDINRDGLALTNAEGGITFDLFANGQPVQVAWTQPSSDDAFLVLDRDGNGAIDSGAELFGSNTPQPAVSKQENSRKTVLNGFRALAVFDEPAQGGNRDGLITEADAIYGLLRLWTDSNHNGVSESRELTKLSDVGIRSVSLRYIASKKTDEFGNLFGLWSHVLMDEDLSETTPLQRRAVDVFLRFIKFGSAGGATIGGSPTAI